MSEAFAGGLEPFDVGKEVPFDEIGLGAALAGVAAGVTLRGKAADDGGGMLTLHEQNNSG